MDDSEQPTMEQLAAWWASTNTWEAPFSKGFGTWSDDEIMGAFRILDLIVPQHMKDEAWRKKRSRKKKKAD